jgi:hypothetical protein
MNAADAWAMVETMARMQEAHNRHVHAEWRLQRYPYYRAVWVECAELLDHFGWKWWKHQAPEAEQVKLEIVDIWHFGLSDLMRAGTLGPDVAEALLGAGDAPPSRDPEAFRAAVETLAVASLAERRFVLGPFVSMLGALPLPLDELFRLYVGKNVLNNFRQAHGYKTGTYRKLWNGREDNAHLVELLARMECAPEALPETLYERLEARYRAHPVS